VAFLYKEKKSFAFLEKLNCCELNINDPQYKSLQPGYLKNQSLYPYQTKKNPDR